MSKESAGLLMFRRTPAGPEFLLVHPGGPFWAKKDLGAWSIPKGEIQPGEAPLAAACREFNEELGLEARGPFLELTPVKQKGGKVVHAWAFEGNCDPHQIHSGTFSMEWPPRSGRSQEFPEVDRAQFFSAAEAADRINPAQVGIIMQCAAQLGGRQGGK